MDWLSRVCSGTGKYAHALLTEDLPYTDGHVRAWKAPAGYQAGVEIMGWMGTEIKNKNGNHGGWAPHPGGNIGSTHRGRTARKR